MADCNIVRYHGDTWTLPVAVTDDAGVAIDLTGYTIVFRLETRSDTDFYFSDPVGATANTSGISISRNDVAGTFTLTLTSTLMATLSEKIEYLWDITITSGTGVVLTLVVGTFSTEEKAID